MTLAESSNPPYLGNVRLSVVMDSRLILARYHELKSSNLFWKPGACSSTSYMSDHAHAQYQYIRAYSPSLHNSPHALTHCLSLLNYVETGSTPKISSRIPPISPRGASTGLLWFDAKQDCASPWLHHFRPRDDPQIRTFPNR